MPLPFTLFIGECLPRQKHKIANLCFGGERQVLEKASVNISEEFDAWFPVIGTANGYTNTLSRDRMQLITESQGAVDINGMHLERTKLVFGKIENEYAFLGAFRGEQAGPRSVVFTRVATGIQLQPQYLLLGEDQTDPSNYNYDYVWFAAAALTLKKCRSGGITLADLSLTQAEIRETATIFRRDHEGANAQKVNQALISQHCNGAHPSCNRPYLRAVGNRLRRLAFPGEFGGGELPPRQDMGTRFTLPTGEVFEKQELFDFVQNDFSKLLPTLHDMLQQISTFSDAVNQPLGGHPLNAACSDPFPAIISRAAWLPREKYIVSASVGQGAWGSFIWQAVLNRNITGTTTEGVDVIYLHAKNTNSVYLCLNQGSDKLEKRLSGSIGVQDRVVAALRRNAEQYSQQLTNPGFETDIELIDFGNSADEKKRRYYKSGAIFFKKYSLDNLPDEETLRGDLRKMIAVYERYYRDIFPTTNHEQATAQPNTPNMTDQREEVNNVAIPELDLTEKNLILYGPPGTGKTYNSVVYAVTLCDGQAAVSGWTYPQFKSRYDELVKDGRIAFTTFHQSFGYEEFIEGIKPEIDNGSDHVGYTIEDGCFKKFCKRAHMAKTLRNTPVADIPASAKVWKVVLESAKQVSEGNETKRRCFADGIIAFDWQRPEDHEGTYTANQIDHLNYRVHTGDVVVSYAGPGAMIDAIGVITGDAKYDETAAHYRWTRSVRWIQSDRVHDLYAMNGNVQFDNTKLQPLSRVSADSILALLHVETEEAEAAEAETPYVFIIDEINRGNISKIFGELITLIEKSKRDGADEKMSAALPYSGEPFSVPENVYILGTMNTADRSIALMDTALRRRFQFIEMMPKPELLQGEEYRVPGPNNTYLNTQKMLEVINKRIEILFDREHTIGHALLMGLKDVENGKKLAKLGSIFEKSIVPLLQEYFYDDYEKIRLVLGDNDKTGSEIQFIMEESTTESVFKGTPDIGDLPDKKYSINLNAFTNIESYFEIGIGDELKGHTGDESTNSAEANSEPAGD